jgi:hypothetical protein
MNEPITNQPSSPLKFTKSVTLSLPEWCFLTISLVVSAARKSRSAVIERYVQQHLSAETPAANSLNFAHEENRSFTVQLPVEQCDFLSEQAVRQGIREGEYLKRLLVDRFPPAAVAVMQELLAILKQPSQPESPPESIIEQQLESLSVATTIPSSLNTTQNEHDVIENFIDCYNSGQVPTKGPIEVSLAHQPHDSHHFDHESEEAKAQAVPEIPNIVGSTV